MIQNTKDQFREGETPNEIDNIRALLEKAEACEDKDYKLEAALPISVFIGNAARGVRVCLDEIDKRRDLHRLVVAALIWRDRKPWEPEFLIMRRPSTAAFYPDKWVAPGGGVDASDFEDANGPLVGALYRELYEEIGPVLVQHPRFLCERAFIRPDGVGVVVLTYCAGWVSGDPEITPEAVEFAWVTVEESKAYDLVGSTHNELEQAARTLEPF